MTLTEIRKDLQNLAYTFNGRMTLPTNDGYMFQFSHMNRKDLWIVTDLNNNFLEAYEQSESFNRRFGA